MAAKPVLLLVEDDQLILMHATMALEDAGYEVLAVRDAEAALAHAETRPDIDALFTDIELPGACGLDLAAMLCRERPAMKLVVTSGIHAVETAALPEGGVFVSKPYTAAQMRRVLDAVG